MAKTSKNKNLDNIVTGTATEWAGQVATYKRNKKDIKRSQQFALDLMDYLEENEISQKELATGMDVSPQQVNKILRAKANLTFDTIDKIAEALGVNISTPQIITNKKTT
ncbi:MAG: helix-turn-helix transcriptional regulator [Mesonia sp.]